MVSVGAQVQEVLKWRESRDEIVRAALTELAANGASLDFLAMQRALGAAFGKAAEQRATIFGCDVAFGVLSQLESRMNHP